jgi:hypothetical protein
MKQSSFEDLPALRPQQYENIFNIYKDDNGMYFYNLLQNVVLPTLPESYTHLIITEIGDTWTKLSWDAYGTIHLWWVILLVNNITNPLQLPEPGTTLKFIRREYLGYLIKSINLK